MTGRKMRRASTISHISVCYEQVKPERARKAERRARREHWWLFWRDSARPCGRRSRTLDEVLVIASVSKTVMPVRVQLAQCLSEQAVVFATDSFADQAVLSSSSASDVGDQVWIDDADTTHATRHPTYSRPSHVPRPTDRLAEIGRTLDTERREIMLRRDLGLTKLYNLVNDPDFADSADPIGRMREIHVELDQAVMDAYGWGDVPLDHGFHTYRQMQRWTVSPTARVEILDRLLEENLRRAEAQGEAPPPAEDEDEGDDE